MLLHHNSPMTDALWMVEETGASQHQRRGTSKRKRGAGAGAGAGTGRCTDIHTHVPPHAHTDALEERDAVDADVDADVDVDVESTLLQMERSNFHLSNSENAEFYRSLIRQDLSQYLLPRLQRSHWKHLSSSAKHHIGFLLQDHCLQTQDLGLRFVGVSCDLPVFECPCTRLQFILIPGGSYRPGLSPALRDQLHQCVLEYFQVLSLDQLTPVQQQHASFQQVLPLLQAPHSDLASSSSMDQHKVSVDPFLLATTPLSFTRAMEWTSGRRVGPNGMVRLPTETEWEYAARGGGWDILFPYDCRIRSTTPNVTRAHQTTSRNAFGLYELGVQSELCSLGNPAFTSGQQQQQQHSRVERGGGAEVWSLVYHSRTVQETRMGCEPTSAVRLAIDLQLL